MLQNSYRFIKPVILWDVISEAFNNKFLVTYVREYKDKNNKLPDGYILTLMVLEDNYDYGLDKNGNEIDNNQFNTFDVTVLSQEIKVEKGDEISLHNFREDVSYVIKYDLLLRFDSIKLLKEVKNEKKNNQ